MAIPFKHKGLFALSIFGFLLFAIADISAVEWLKRVIGYINDTQMAFKPPKPGSFSTCVSILRGIGFYIGNYFMANVGLKVVHNMREDIIRSLLYQPMSFLIKHLKVK